MSAVWTVKVPDRTRTRAEVDRRRGLVLFRVGWVLVVTTALFVTVLCLTTPEPPTVVQYYEVDQP